ncbi:hypothetical protein PCANC_00407 [Puccinia coronata f. sp. avenae]|uniref:pyridoxal kinase n=1 Tax=Puccinia coronata f. sp. avenae TaxID=200324 RepID=A0A2N5T356_9BASI|nr:hypothetical protein PCANC_11923 [Puccinia coronata f. sp. avenae]PLW24423.1 hypothetical protein PCASD_11559 [Puccinia coronata f. sp. avenae]PLW52120.1 hypothetical protein PCASD_02039 [Puccinia coronata f. sp. avenae]PLW58739.1 hypothetical protein PCANC_00407 [Puccinia coronata f. sp. avenae]
MPRVLSIQSHVVSGYVGNKSATFPLQLLGWDVDALNTVQFSNHLGYGSHGGDKMAVEHLISCIDGLEKNELLKYDALLTGFTPGPEGIDALIYSIKKIKATSPNVAYLVDPVMGDDGKLYVSEQVPPKYKELLKLATIATPNEFEAQILTSLPTNTLPEIRDCLRAFHDMHGLKHIVITSISISRSLVAHLDDLPPPDSDGNVMICAGSTKDGEPWMIIFPKRNCRFDGVGDLFASILLGRFMSTDPAVGVSQAAELALASTQGVMDHTGLVTSSDGSPDGTLSSKAAKARRSELKIIQSRAAIESPTVKWKCRSFDAVINSAK